MHDTNHIYMALAFSGAFTDTALSNAFAGLSFIPHETK